MEHQRTISLLFGLGGFLVAIFVYQAWQQISGAASFEDPLVAGMPLSGLVAAVCGVIAFFVLMRNERATSFFDSVVDELFKIHWPTREETMNNTSIVVGATVFLATLLSVYDVVWSRLSSLLLFSGH